MTDIWSSRFFTKIAKRRHDHRSPYQRDRARILHSAAFRRLQNKTQVMGSGQNDFYRTRLTHSLEASQIGSGISAQLRAKYPELSAKLFPQDDSLIEALCLAHDIGHPPFGHGGEIALHYMMRNHGGFEGNGQTFRIVSRLEPFSEGYGMNLSRRTLLGLLKYPQTLDNLKSAITPAAPSNLRQLKASEWHPPKGVYSDDSETLNWLLEPLNQSDRELFQSSMAKDQYHHAKTCFKSLDCSMMELADDIAYGIHDLEDAIVTGVVNASDFIQHVVTPLQAIDEPWLQEICQTLTDKLFSQKPYKQKEAIGSLVNYLITAIELVDLNERQALHFEQPLLRYNAMLPEVANAVLDIFKGFVYRFVIRQPAIQQIEYRGQQVVMELFEALSSDPERLLPNFAKQQWLSAMDKEQNAQRAIADYVASMTDDFAASLYQTLFMPDSKQSMSWLNI